MFQVHGRQKFLIALREMARREYQDAVTVLKHWNHLSERIQRETTFDDLMLRTQVDDVVGFVEKLAGVLYQLGIGWGNVLAAAQFPSVVQASVNRALGHDGIADRRMQFDHHRFLPQRQGTSISIQLNQTNVNSAASDGDERGLPPMEHNTLEMRALVRRVVPDDPVPATSRIEGKEPTND